MYSVYVYFVQLLENNQLRKPKVLTKIEFRHRSSENNNQSKRSNYRYYALGDDTRLIRWAKGLWISKRAYGLETITYEEWSDQAKNLSTLANELAFFFASHSLVASKYRFYSRKFFLSRKQEVTSRYFGPYDVVPRAFFFPRWFDWRVRINAKGKWKRKIIFYRAGFVLLLFFLFFLSFLFHLKFLDLCLSWLGRESGRMRRLISSPERPRPPCRPRPKAGRRKIPRPRP